MNWLARDDPAPAAHRALRFTRNVLRTSRTLR
jgi:hypothetical protein